VGQTAYNGTHSYYVNFRGTEIMFHVSTLLPRMQRDPQQIERKKHIGRHINAMRTHLSQRGCTGNCREGGRRVAF